MFGNILEFVLPIVLLIIIHELGHFAAAKFFKIDVEEFGLGFPPRAVRLFKIAETEYTLNWLPLGGFVRIKGETDDVSGGLNQANPWVRIAVFAAGPIANIATAILLLALFFNQVGRPDLTRVLVVNVAENSPAEMAGIQPNDIITRFNDVVVDSGDALNNAVQASLGVESVVELERGGENLTVTLVPRANPPEGEGAIGIQRSYATLPVSFFEGMAWGTSAVWDYAQLLLTIPGRLINGTMNPEDARLVGYKGMYDMHQMVKDTPLPQGVAPWVNSLSFFATISISLGLLNLFPIPAVDGGRILFTLPELIFRRRIPLQYENAINAVSFMLLLALLIYINIQDVVNPAFVYP